MSQSTSSQVDVEVDPATAFEIFTEEVNCWWMQGAINFHDSSKTVEMRIEPGVGGRVYEVHDRKNASGHELGRITRWEPSIALAWESLIDDVLTEVSFEQIDLGTRVTVTATIPDGGRDFGGTAWVGVTPLWLQLWLKARDRGARQREPKALGRLIVAVHYEKPAEAASWLKNAFGFFAVTDIPTEEGPADHTWLEFHVGNASIVILGSDTKVEHTNSVIPWIYVDDIEAHFKQAVEAGATISQPIQTHGACTYVATDLAGQDWTFAQAGPLMLQEPT